MSVLVRMTNTDKRRNSTLQIRPAAFPADFFCTLKESTSILSPTIIIESDSSILSYNYCYIDEFKRYYFIDDIRSLNQNIWEVEMTVDALATYKTQIGDTEMMVLRSSISRNGFIKDTVYPTTGEVTAALQYVQQTTSYDLGSKFTQGCYVLGVLGENSDTSIIGQTLYVLSPSEYQNFTKLLMDSSSSYSWGSLAQGIINSLFNPTDYIVSCYWFPMVIGTTQSKRLFCGKWDSGMTVGVISGDNIMVEFGVTVPHHPQMVSRGRYLNAEPYSQYFLDLGVTQTIHLDSTMLIDEDGITIRYIVDPATGIAKCYGITNDKLQELFCLNVNFGVPVNLSSSKNNLLNLVGDVSSGALSLAMGNPVGYTSSILSAGMDMMSAVSGGTVSNGGANGFLAGHYSGLRRLWARFFRVTDEMPEEYGSPLCEIHKPTDVQVRGGFIQADNTYLAIENALTDEINMIENYLTSGFYFE